MIWILVVRWFSFLKSTKFTRCIFADTDARPQSRSLSPYENVSESDSENSGESVIIFDAKAQRQFRAWQKMQPAVMINKQLHAASENKSSTRSRHDITSDEEDRPLLPGQTRVRLGQRRSNMEIRGDTESSDSDRDGELAGDYETGLDRIPSFEAVETVHYGQQLAVPHTLHSFDTSASEDDQDSSDISDMELSGNNVTGFPSRVKRGPEVDRIDWMLKRTRTVRTGKANTPNRRPAPKG
jgi:hypothetical protein